MRRTLGVAVFAGMIGVTLFGIFLTPLFYYVVRRFTAPKAALASKPPSTAANSLERSPDLGGNQCPQPAA
jgi:multidrug efflux pump